MRLFPIDFLGIEDSVESVPDRAWCVFGTGFSWSPPSFYDSLLPLLPFFNK